jgi:hypothetical protein
MGRRSASLNRVGNTVAIVNERRRTAPFDKIGRKMFQDRRISDNRRGPNTWPMNDPLDAIRQLEERVKESIAATMVE